MENGITNSIMLLSIIIPTCNRNDLLTKCLDCIAPGKQTVNHTMYEVIVTDDGNTNQAKELILENYSWAKWVEGPKRGPAANRNNGAAFATGEWLVFLDDDCLPDENLLVEYRRAINSCKDCCVFEGSIYCLEKTKNPLMISPVNDTGGYLWSCNFCIKTDVFNMVHRFDENFKYPNMEDNDLNYRLRTGGFQISFVPSARVNHPLRLIASPQRLAKYHESWFYYYLKRGEKKNIFALAITIVKTRLRNIMEHRFSWYSIIAFKNLLLELGYTFFYYSFK